MSIHTKIYNLFELRAAKGIDNINDPIRLSKVGESLSSLVEAVNMHVDNSGMLSMRAGQTLIYSGTSPHSFGPDGLFVEGSTLKRLKADETIDTLTSLSANSRMGYCKVGGKIYYTNSVDIGYVDTDKSYSCKLFTNPLDTYQKRMPAGQLIAYYRNRLYVARGNKIYISNAANYQVYDIRTGFKRRSGYITLLQPVHDGIYVADGKTSFWSGLAPDEFQAILGADYNAILGTSALVNKSHSAIESINMVAYWMSERGLCAGANGGNFQNLTINRDSTDTTNIINGTSVFRILNNKIPQYIFVGNQ